jgi:protein-disulfide isomerase
MASDARSWKIATLILAALFIVSFFVPREALQSGPGDAGNGITGEVVIADASNDPTVSLVIISDETCVVCDSSNIEQGLSTYFPTLTPKKVDISTKAGKNLIKRFDIAAVPALIFDGAIAKTANFDKVEAGLDQKEGVYLIQPHITGVGKLLEQPSIEGKPIKGKANAPVQIVEFSDFQCPFCKQFFDETYPQLVREYINTGKANMVFRHLPLDFHEYALSSAIASSCAHEQGKFWEFHDLLFTNQEALTQEDLNDYAKQISLDTPPFADCYNNLRYAPDIAADKNYAASVGISGTPTFVVNGIIIGGAQPYEVFQAVIDAELAKQ